MTADQEILVTTDSLRELLGTGLSAAALETDASERLVIPDPRPAADVNGVSPEFALLLRMSAVTGAFSLWLRQPVLIASEACVGVLFNTSLIYDS